MNIYHRVLAGLALLTLLPSAGPAVEGVRELVAGQTYTIPFPEMPPTFYALDQHKEIGAQMTVYLPSNYDPAAKHPLFIFLSGGNGGLGSNPQIARTLTEGKDFVCVSVPLFRAPDSSPTTKRGAIVITDADGRYMWPFFKTMLAKLDALVPNLDPAHQVLGGFSNGAHATAALLDESDGAIARRFSAFFFGEGGGKLQRYDLLKGKSFLMLSSNSQSRPRAAEIEANAKAAGAATAFIFENVGRHEFPTSAYPAVRAWLRGPALK